MVQFVGSVRVLLREPLDESRTPEIGGVGAIIDGECAQTVLLLRPEGPVEELRQETHQVELRQAIRGGSRYGHLHHRCVFITGNDRTIRRMRDRIDFEHEISKLHLVTYLRDAFDPSLHIQ